MNATDTKKTIYNDFLKSWVSLTSKSAEQTENLSTFKVKYLGYGVTHIYSCLGHGSFFYGGYFSSCLTWNIPWWRKKILHLRSHYSTSKFDTPPPPPVIILRRPLFFFTLQTNRSAFMRENNCSIIDQFSCRCNWFKKKNHAFLKPKLDN